MIPLRITYALGKCEHVNYEKCFLGWDTVKQEIVQLKFFLGHKPNINKQHEEKKKHKN